MPRVYFRVKIRDPQKIKSILFVSFSNIGDAVLSIPTLEVLQKSFGVAKIDIVVGERAKDVFKNYEGLNKVFVYNRRDGLKQRIRFFLDLHRKNYDLVVDLKRSIFSLLGKRRSSVFNFSIRKTHKRNAHLDALKQFGLEIPDLSTFRHNAFFKDSYKVVISPGARSDTKRWKGRKFAILADRLIENANCEVYWIGDASEVKLIKNIQSHMRNKSMSYAGEYSWSESVDLIKKSDLVITNDSAPLHVADHYRKRVLAFFGPMDPEEYGSQFTKSGTLFSNEFCSPCKNAQCVYNHECLENISEDEAFKRALHLIRGSIEDVKKEKVLVVRLDRMGDLLLSFPAVEAVRNSHPNAEIHFLTRPETRDLLERCTSVDRVISYDYRKNGEHESLIGYLRLYRKLRKNNYKFTYILHPTHRSHLLCYLLGIPNRIGYKTRYGFLLTHGTKDQRHLELQHESKNVLDVVNSYHKSNGVLKSEFRVYPEDHDLLNKRLEFFKFNLSDKYVVFHPTSSSPSKCWPLDYYIKLAERFVQEMGYKVVFVGETLSQDEFQKIDRIKSTFVINLLNQLSIVELATVAKCSQIFISNDSGPSHLAASTGARVLSIFGRTRLGLGSKRWHPIGKNANWIQKDVGCVSCLADNCNIDFECLKQLTDEEVFQKAKDQLAIPAKEFVG